MKIAKLINTEVIKNPTKKVGDVIRSRKLKVSLLAGLESLRSSKGIFTAADSSDYAACWVRDQLYSTLAYYYLGEHEKFTEGVWVVFDILHKFEGKIEQVICHKPVCTHEYIHAKFHPETLDEVTEEWGHHQLDAVGLLLYIVAFAHERNISIFRDGKDVDMIQLLVQYLTAVRYWDVPDNGMWEEGMDLHTSSIGACVAGLSYIKKKGLAVVPDQLIKEGTEALYKILPNETPSREMDMAQLSLLWPYNILNDDLANIILDRVEGNLICENGLNRYLDDNYYRSSNGVSAEWTFGFFWLSIIYSQRGEVATASEWFEKGMKTITPEGHLPELYQDDIPNPNTPLAWSHSFAIIAARKLGLI